MCSKHCVQLTFALNVSFLFCDSSQSLWKVWYSEQIFATGNGTFFSDLSVNSLLPSKILKGIGQQHAPNTVYFDFLGLKLTSELYWSDLIFRSDYNNLSIHYRCVEMSTFYSQRHIRLFDTRFSFVYFRQLFCVAFVFSCFYVHNNFSLITLLTNDEQHSFVYVGWNVMESLEWNEYSKCTLILLYYH